jgi:hypothetical protein
MDSKFFIDLDQGFPLVTTGFMLLSLSGAFGTSLYLDLDGVCGCPAE